MKKVILTSAMLAALLGMQTAKAQLVDEKNVTITMDLQPILQLDMTGPQNIDFVFDQIAEYVGGITQYGVTQLKVSSSVSWDLYAVGYASGALTNWDVQVAYGSGLDALATDVLPCSLLELRQNQANPFPNTSVLPVDYSSPFQVTPSTAGLNNIYTSITPYAAPAATEKYIAGGSTADATAYVPGGTYLVNTGVAPAVVVGAGSNYYYNIDYRIVPGLPAIFPNAALNDGITSQALNLPSPANDGVYARPGVYTMNVKYVLRENE